MPASDVAREIDSTMKRTATALRAATKAALADAAKLSRSELRAKAGQVPGPDRVFSNFRKAGALDVSTRQRDGVLTVSPRGPWKIAETGAAPHPVNHPGTHQGRMSWTTGQADIFDKLDRTIPADIEADVSKAFGG